MGIFNSVFNQLQTVVHFGVNLGLQIWKPNPGLIMALLFKIAMRLWPIFGQNHLFEESPEICYYPLVN